MSIMNEEKSKNIWDDINKIDINNLKRDERGIMTWDEFRRSGNTEASLSVKAKILTRILIDISAGYCQLLHRQVQKAKELKDLPADYKKCLERVSKDKLDSLWPEFLYFFMHITDRVAYQLFGNEKKRLSFMNDLYMDIANKYLKIITGIDNPFAGIGGWFGEGYNKCQNEYSKYKVMLPLNFKMTTPPMPESFELCKDTLFGEFSRKIEKILLENNKENWGFGYFADIVLSNIILHYNFLALPRLFEEKRDEDTANIHDEKSSPGGLEEDIQAIVSIINERIKGINEKYS